MTVHELDTLGEPRNGPVQQELEKKTKVITVPQVRGSWNQAFRHWNTWRKSKWITYTWGR